MKIFSSKISHAPLLNGILCLHTFKLLYYNLVQQQTCIFGNLQKCYNKILKLIYFRNYESNYCDDIYQRWSRGHKARGQGQGHKKNSRPRPRTAFPRTDTQKKGLHKNFSSDLHEKTFSKIFQALHKILTIQKIVLSSGRGQASLDLRPRGQG